MKASGVRPNGCSCSNVPERLAGVLAGQSPRCRERINWRMITIIDYGLGNLGSILSMLRRTGHQAQVTDDIEVIARAEKLILPGVGAFDAGMQRLESNGLREILTTRVLRDHVPFLGICLGMQLMFESSEEGELKGLGWFPGRFALFPEKYEQAGLRVPHMGWNFVEPVRAKRLFREAAEQPRFYFIHSYRLLETDPEDVAAIAFYGGRFVCAVERENVMGVQFHPERSHRYGIALLKAFASL